MGKGREMTTPGPWSLVQVEDRGIRRFCPVGPDGLSVLTVVAEGWTPFAAVYKDDDARLIAAVPDLLETLRAASNYIDTLGGDSTSYRAAITKATKEEGK
jgi:hypothetical protein